MYQASPSRRERAKKFLGSLADKDNPIRKVLDKYENGKTIEIAKKENDEISSRMAHDYFLKLSVILEDYSGTMEWEAELKGRVQRAKVLYRLTIAMKVSEEERQRVLNELLERERMLKESHQSYLATVRDP
jgi:hypothetical protein